MKATSLIGLVTVLVITSSFAQEVLRVEVTNIRNSAGTIMVGLFTSEETFLKKAFMGRTVKAGNEKVFVTFENIPPGEYAISVIHDENENAELDSNFFGIPKEGFGFGNDAMGTFGPPSFDKAKVKLSGDVSKQVVKMRYL